MNKILVKYNANNSGGSWWLEDEDWYKLEKAGWSVKWFKDEKKNKGLYENGKFLGALATDASKEFENIDAALSEFAMLTGQDPKEIGCTTCGPPHNFSYRDDTGYHYVSGDW